MTCQAVVIEDRTGRRAVLVSMDVVGVTSGWGTPLRRAIAASLRCDPRAVLLNASHTHSSTETIWDYYASAEPMPTEMAAHLRELHRRVVQCVEEAARRLSTAAMSWHVGKTSIAINRRRMTPAGMDHAPNPHGWVDDRLIAIRLTCGVNTAVIATCACHPVVVYGAWPEDLCADFPGAFREAMRRTGVGHVQFAQGLGGDVRPRILAHESEERFRPAVQGDVERVGDALASDVRETLGLPGERVDLNIAFAEAMMPVRAGEPIAVSVLEDYRTHSNQAIRHHAIYWLHRAGAFDAVLPWSIGAIRFDRKHVLMHMAGEPVGEWRRRIQALSPKTAFAFWGYTQDYTTYLPTDAMIDEGGYEVDLCNLFQRFFPQRLAHGIDEIVMQAADRLLREVGMPAEGP